MHKWLRYYSQNRIKVWTIIIAIVFVIVLIQVLNNMAKRDRQNKNNQQEEVVTNENLYEKESESIITVGNVPDEYQKEFGNIIEKFYTYCTNHQPEKAYELLAPDTKKVLYPSEKQFEKLYYEEKFQGNKDYSFQSWTKSPSTGTYIYQVKIFEDMLSTGKASEYKEDYVTIVPIKDTYRLNINSYVARREINQKQSNDYITAEVSVSDVYLDYEVYTIRIKNNTNQTILLDTRRKTDTTYVVDDKGNKFEAFLYENKNQELILKPQESKSIQIKFNDSYRSNIKISSMNFTDIVKEEEYKQNKEISGNTLKINI